jgi:ATP-dependent RNA helicase DDX54/DBP10
MPYLLDLQLFLGRPLVYTNSPIDNFDCTSQIVTGTIPFQLLENDAEFLHCKLQEDFNLKNYLYVADNGYKLYIKSRAAASPEAYKRYKEISLGCPFGSNIHPLLIPKVPKVELDRQTLIEEIRNFRPQETILEVGARGIKNESTVLMKRRRKMNDKAILISREKAMESKEKCSVIPQIAKRSHSEIDPELEKSLKVDFVEDEVSKPRRSKKQKTSDFKDEEFYMEYFPADYNTEKGLAVNSTTSLASSGSRAVLELMNDEGSTSKAKKGKLVWDPRKKNFKRETDGADNVKMIKGESGIKLPASLKSDRYNQWQKKTKIMIPRNGDVELAQAKQLAYVPKRFQRQTNSDSQKGPKSELKGATEIAKMRHLKEKRREKNGRAPKGKSFKKPGNFKPSGKPGKSGKPTRSKR